MKKHKFAFLFILVIFLVTFAACTSRDDDENPNDQHPEPEEKQLTLEHNDISLYIGETFTLKANLKNLEGTIVWSSENEEIAQVENGKITALAEGTTVITASLAEYFTVCTVKITKSRNFLFRLGSENSILENDPNCASISFKGEEVADKEFAWTSKKVLRKWMKKGIYSFKVGNFDYGSKWFVEATFELNVVNKSL